MTLKGIDVSNWQGKSFDWESEHAAGVDFAFIKATQGTGYTDPDFKRNWTVSKERGLVRGAYHYLHPEQKIGDQIGLFLQIVRDAGLEPGDLLAVDYEVTGGSSVEDAAVAAHYFCYWVANVTGASTIVYTTGSMAKSGYCDRLGTFPLWLAAPGETDVQPPMPWTLLSFAQTGQRYLDHDTGYFESASQLRKLGVPGHVQEQIEIPTPAVPTSGAATPATPPPAAAASECAAPSAAAPAASSPAPTSVTPSTAPVTSSPVEHLEIAERLLTEAKAMPDKTEDAYAARIVETVAHALIGVGKALHLI